MNVGASEGARRLASRMILQKDCEAERAGVRAVDCCEAEGTWPRGGCPVRKRGSQVSSSNGDRHNADADTDGWNGSAVAARQACSTKSVWWNDVG